MELLVKIMIQDRRCALRAIDVHSVMEIESITPVPKAPAHILGLSTKRSQTLTVVDCKKAAGIDGEATPTGKRAAVVEHEGHTYALLVDDIDDVEDTSGEIAQIAGGYGADWSHIAEGMVETAGGPALLLSVAKLVAGPQKFSQAA